MRTIVAVAVAFTAIMSTACTTTAGVKATLYYDPPGAHSAVPEELTLDYEETFSTSALAVACSVTAIFYGGACWAYLAVPYDAQEEAALVNARAEAMGLGRCIGVKSMLVVSARAAHGLPGERFVVVKRQDGREVPSVDARRLCEEQPAPPTPPTSPPAASATESAGQS